MLCGGGGAWGSRKREQGVLGSLFRAMAWIFEPTLPSEEGAGWGDLPELP